MSRVGSPNNIKFSIRPVERPKEILTSNVVYKEVLVKRYVTYLKYEYIIFSFVKDLSQRFNRGYSSYTKYLGRYSSCNNYQLKLKSFEIQYLQYQTTEKHISI